MAGDRGSWPGTAAPAVGTPRCHRSATLRHHSGTVCQIFSLFHRPSFEQRPLPPRLKPALGLAGLHVGFCLSSVQASVS